MCFRRVDNDIQGAYWGTTYVAYALIYTPGYYVYTWNLQNRDMIRPLYVCCFLGRALRKSAANQIYPSVDSHLRMLLLRGPPPDQDGYSAGLVQSVCFHRQSQERFLVGLQYAVSPTPSHLGILPSKQMLFSAGRDALLG